MRLKRYKHMTPEKARQIRERYFNRPRISQSKLAEEFGITQSAVSKIICGYRWAG